MHRAELESITFLYQTILILFLNVHSLKLAPFMMIDFARYRKSISSNQVWKFILFFAFAYFLFIIFNDSINTYWVDKILKYFPQTIFSDLIFLASFIHIVLIIRRAFKHRLIPTISSVGFFIFFIFF